MCSMGWSRLPAMFFAVFLLGVQVEGFREAGETNVTNSVPCLATGKFYRNTEAEKEHCDMYYLCLEGEVYQFKCSPGRFFDVKEQTCNIESDVHNCEVASPDTKTEMAMAVLAGQEKCTSSSNRTLLACASGDCIPFEYFCDGSNDCEDGSDEDLCHIFNPHEAQPCDPGLCQLPQCFCSERGKIIPGHLVRTQTPQMVTLTFHGAVNHENWDIYIKHFFTPEKRNPNSCPIKATFFVAHPYTNYRHVQKLWNDGHEIAVNSITHRKEEWWNQNATVEDWFDEMVGQANIISRFASVRMEDLGGMRVPHLGLGSNRQFLMMQEFGFIYDATLVAPVEDPPFWPYTLDYKMPHNCLYRDQSCPYRSYAGLWELVINPLKHGNASYATLEETPSNFTAEDVYNLLMFNFKRHYRTNRAPFGIHLKAEWLKNNDYLAAVKRFITEILKLPDIYFVTGKQVIDWMKRPTPIIQLKKFQPWQCKARDFEECEMACLKPTTCKLPSKMIGHDQYMITCTDCPKSYPWLRNEFGLD